MKKLSIIVAAVLLCACGNDRQGAVPGPITTGEDCIVSTAYGKILGYNDAGIYTFKGVPYAKAERFMPPQAPDKWDGVRKTQVYGPQAMQGQNMNWGGTPSDYDFGFQFKKELNSEDCQMLNVWTPGLDGRKRPVFFWMHGGGFNDGSAIDLDCYEGRALADKGINITELYCEKDGKDGFTLIGQVEVDPKDDPRTLLLDLEDIVAEYEFTVKLQHKNSFVATNQLRKP